MPAFPELSRFSAAGKTFFFNKGTAKTGSNYLVINALWGKGNQERVIVFPAHFLEFRKHTSEAIEQLTGISFSSSSSVEKEVCPDCGMPKISWRVLSSSDGSAWMVVCGECKEIILSNRPDAAEVIRNG